MIGMAGYGVWKKLGNRRCSIHELSNSVCCILRYSIGRHAIQYWTLVRCSGFKMKITSRSRNSTNWKSSLQSREPTLGSAHYSHLQILFPKAFHYLNLHVCVSTVDPRSPHTLLSMYTNERARTRPRTQLTKSVARLGIVLTRTCAPHCWTWLLIRHVLLSYIGVRSSEHGESISFF